MFSHLLGYKQEKLYFRRPTQQLHIWADVITYKLIVLVVAGLQYSVSDTEAKLVAAMVHRLSAWVHEQAGRTLQGPNQKNMEL